MDHYAARDYGGGALTDRAVGNTATSLAAYR